ncbi:MAG: hypothetical protein AAF226_10775, partial [Verrucomicrobiota bacterium]
MRTFIQRFWPWLAALISGLLLALCYPGFELHGFIWIWQAPLLAALWFSRASWKRALWLGWLCGFTFFTINMNWFHYVGEVVESSWAGIGAVIGMSLYLGLYFAAFAVFATTVGRWVPEDLSTPVKSKSRDIFGQSLTVLKIAFLNGACWCGLEWLRGILFTGFGWNGLGVALKNHLTLVQAADMIGVTGYGFILMFCGVIAFCTIVRLIRELQSRQRVRPHIDFGIGMITVSFLLLYGLGKLAETPRNTIDLKTRIIQLNIPIEDKFSTDTSVMRDIIFRYRDMTRMFVESTNYDLVLWPETALPAIFGDPEVRRFFDEMVLKGEDFHLLTGMEDLDPNNRLTNNIVLM